MLNLLRAVASPADEVSLAGVLRSPFFSLADETLFWLVESAGSLNAGLFGRARCRRSSRRKNGSKPPPPPRRSRISARDKDSLPIATLLDEALARTGYDAALLAEFLGERKLANLHKLIEQARTADSGDVLDLAGFITQLAEFIAREPKEALAATLSESADVIRLMTIHHAKGLEFPLVIVPDLDRKPDFRAPAAALDARLGPLVTPPTTTTTSRTTTGIDLFRTLEKRRRRRGTQAAALRRHHAGRRLSHPLQQPRRLRRRRTRKRLDEAARRAVRSGDRRLPRHVAGRLRRRRRSASPTASRRPISNRPASRAAPTCCAIVEEARDLAASGGRRHRAARRRPDSRRPAARRQFSVSRLSGKLVRPDARESR